MFRSLKITGLLAVAAIAATGLTATAAQATPLFEADKYPATIDGTSVSTSVFGFGGIYKWECKKSAFLGSLPFPSSELTLTTAYEECTWTWPITLPPKEPDTSVVQMTMNGCDYRLRALEAVAGHEYLSQVEIQCPAGKQVVIDLRSEASTACTLTVPAQSKLGHVRLIDQTNKEGPSDDDVTAQITLTKLHYSQDSLFTCPVKQGTYADLSYTAIATFNATNEGKSIGFRVSGF